MIIAAVFVLSACSTWNSFRQTFITKPENESVPTITIGVIEPQTGRYAGKGKDEIKGIELANSIYNNVDGYDVRLVKVKENEIEEGKKRYKAFECDPDITLKLKQIGNYFVDKYNLEYDIYKSTHKDAK